MENAMNPGRHLVAALAALAVSAAATPLLARQPQPGPAAAALTSLSPAERTAALDAIRAKVRELYVFPERRKAIIDRLNAGQKAGRYDLASPAAFVEAVSADLSAASGDKHMYLVVDPAQYAASLAPVGQDGAAMDALFAERAQRDNHGLTEMKILGGNIRYLKIGQFHWVDDVSGQAYADAMRFLAGGDAIIIDLRGNGGGSGAAVQYLTSYFTKGEALLLTFLRGSETPVQSRALTYLPGPRLIDRPLYVLTDRGSGSAAEEFAYHVQQFKLGELIGQTTAGAANNNDLVPITPGFMLSISAGRPVHPVSDGNWEAVGVRPDIESAPAGALDVAQQRALARLASDPQRSPVEKAEYAWISAEVAARLAPPVLSAATLEPLAGRYGEATVTLREGSLWFTRAGRPERRLTPLDDKGLFAIDGVGGVRLRFFAGGLEMIRFGDPVPVRLMRP